MPTSTALSVDKKGFTLIELLIVVTIIGVLAYIGISVYGGMRARSNDAKLKVDVDAFASAYESNFDEAEEKYQALSSTDFTNDIPKAPDGGAYQSCPLNESTACQPGLADNGGWFHICVKLSDSSEYCKQSKQGTTVGAKTVIYDSIVR